MDNMDLWNKVSKTDPSHTKKAKIGQMNITAVCPQSQRMKATEIFGAYGQGWGVNPGSESFEFMDIGDTKLCLYRAVMFFKLGGDGGEFPICSTVKVSYVTKNGEGYRKIDDEYAKKAQTDALTKGLSFLGFNADIFLGKFDDNRYVQERTAEVAAEKAAVVSDVDQQWVNACKADPEVLNQIEDPAYKAKIQRLLK